MKALIPLFCLVLAGCPASAPPPPNDPAEASTSRVPVDDKQLTDALAKAGRPVLAQDTVDWDTFGEPVQAGARNPDGYPIYLISCDKVADTCSGPGGKTLGPFSAVVMRLTPIRNADVLSNRYRCKELCVDVDGHVVGRPSHDMTKYLTKHPH